MTRLVILFLGLFFFAMHHYSVRAAEPNWWIYMYAHEHDEPVRVLEITSNVDAFGQCEFFRDLLDASLMDVHSSAFFTCVTDIDLVVGELT